MLTKAVHYECPINTHLWDTQGSPPYENPKEKAHPQGPPNSS